MDADVVAERLAAVVAALPLRACHHAAGRAAPASGATMSGCARVLCAVSGAGRMLLPCGSGTVTVALSAGDAVLVDAQAWNRPLPGDLGFVVLFIDGDHLRIGHWRQDGRRLPGYAQLRCTLPGVPPALRLAVAAATALPPDPVHQPTLRCLLEAAVREAQRHLAADGDDPAAGRRLWQAVGGWLDQHLAEPIDRRAAAIAFGVHPGHLSRVFRAHGEGFTASLIRRRLERARHLLAGSGLPVAEVARRCGYPDPAAFAKACRARLGRSPRQLRDG